MDSTAPSCAFITYKDPLGVLHQVEYSRLHQLSNAWLHQLPLSQLHHLVNGPGPECRHCVHTSDDDEPQLDYFLEEGLICCCNCQQQLLDVHAAHCCLYLKQHEQQLLQGEQGLSTQVRQQLGQHEQQQHQQQQQHGQHQPAASAAASGADRSSAQLQQRQRQQQSVVLDNAAADAACAAHNAAATAGVHGQHQPPGVQPWPASGNQQTRAYTAAAREEVRCSVQDVRQAVERIKQRMQEQGTVAASNPPNPVQGQCQSGHHVLRRIVVKPARPNPISRRRSVKKQFMQQHFVVSTAAARAANGQPQQHVPPAEEAEAVATEQAEQQGPPDAHAAGDQSFDQPGSAALEDDSRAAPVDSPPDVYMEDVADTAAAEPAPTQPTTLGRYEFKPRTSQPARSTTDVRAAEASNWQSFHQGQPTSSLEMSLRTKLDQLDLEELQMTSLRNAIMHLMQTAACPKCGVRVCDSRTDAAAHAVREVEVLIVTFTALISVKVPVLECSGCDSAEFNLHPFQAGCFPSNPKYAVSPLRLTGKQQTPYLWFRMDLLEHLLITRQHQPRMGLGAAATAIKQHMMTKNRWDSRISKTYFRQKLNTAMHQYAVLHMEESDPKAVGLQEGILSCCHVCREGHRDFLVQQGVVADVHGVPLLNKALSGQAGLDARSAAAAAATAATAAATAAAQAPAASSGGTVGAGNAPAAAAAAGSTGPAASATEDGNGTAFGGSSGPGTAAGGSNGPSSTAGGSNGPGSTAGGSNGSGTDVRGSGTAAGGSSGPSAAAGGSSGPDAAAGGRNGPSTAAAGNNGSGTDVSGNVTSAARSGGGYIQGLGGLWLPSRPRPAGWHEALAKLNKNPLGKFKPYAKALIIHGISFDGLRRVPHLAKAGTATTYSNPARFRIVPEDYVDQYITFAGKSTAVTSSCNDFDADKQLGRTSKVYDISGIVGMFCSFYDINCKFKAHFQDFALLRSGWSAVLVAWALAMAMPLPPFHINMHNPECIERNTLKQVEAAGRGAGEPAEIFNRFLGLSGMVLQYAAKPVRELWLEELMVAWRAMKEADLPRLLVSMFSKAVLQERLSAKEQSRLAQLALQYVSEEQVQQMILPPAPIIGPSSNTVQLTWRAEMAELLLVIGMLKQSSDALMLEQILPSSLLMGEASRAAVLKTKQDRLASLEQQYSQQWTPHLRCSSFMQGLAELCLFKVQTLQCELGDLSRTYMFSRMLQQHIGSHRQQHRKLDKHLNKMGSKMDATINQLFSWVAQLRQYLQHLRVDDSVVLGAFQATYVSQSDGYQGSWDSMTLGVSKQNQASAAYNLKQLLCNGESPWTSGAAAGSVQGVGPLAKRMGVVALDIQAACVEQELVLYEMQTLLESYRRELQLLQTTQHDAEEQLLERVEQQGDIQQQLDDSSLSVAEQHTLHRSLLTAQNAAHLLVGQRLLLLQRQARLQNLLAVAEAMFRLPLQHNVTTAAAAASEQQFMAAADEILQQGDDGCDEDDSDEPEEMFAAADEQPVDIDAQPTVAEDTGHVELGAAAAAATVASSPRLVRSPLQQPVSAGDHGAAAQSATPTLYKGLQLWEASPGMQYRYQQVLGQLELLTAEQRQQGITDYLSKQSLYMLRPEEQLNDEILNEMFKRFLQINVQLSAGGSIDPVHIFPTYFMEHLWLGFQKPPYMQQKLDYPSVQRHTLPKRLAAAGQPKSSIFDCRLVVVPCHLPRHWVVVVADLQQQRITYIDPLLGADVYGVMGALASYLKLEARTKRGQVLKTNTWVKTCAKDIPIQTDDHSCGLYALTFAKHLACGGDVGQLASCGISEETAVAARAHIMCQLTEGKEI